VALNSKLGKVFNKLVFGFPLHALAPNPRWSSNFRQVEDTAGVLIDWCVARVNETRQRILNKAGKDEVMHDEVSILEKLILTNGPDSPIPTVMAFDMMIAGIDTTGNTSGFLLYNLAM